MWIFRTLDDGREIYFDNEEKLFNFKKAYEERMFEVFESSPVYGSDYEIEKLDVNPDIVTTLDKIFSSIYY